MFDFRRKHFPNQASVMTSLKHMAVLYKKLKEFDRACEIYDELLSHSIEASGADSVPTANAMVSECSSHCEEVFQFCCFTETWFVCV